MRCRACGSQIRSKDPYCEQCGSRLPDHPIEGSTRHANPGRLLARRHEAQAADDEEVILWRGRYSWKGLIREILGGLVVSGVVAMLAFRSPDPELSRLAVPAIGLIGLALLLRLGFKKLEVRYTLTSQRLLHEHGILYRRSRRIEVLDSGQSSAHRG